MPAVLGHEVVVVVAGIVASGVEPVVVREVPRRPTQRQHDDLSEIVSEAPAAEVPASGGGRQQGAAIGLSICLPAHARSRGVRGGMDACCSASRPSWSGRGWCGGRRRGFPLPACTLATRTNKGALKTAV